LVDIILAFINVLIRFVLCSALPPKLDIGLIDGSYPFAVREKMLSVKTMLYCSPITTIAGPGCFKKGIALSSK